MPVIHLLVSTSDAFAITPTTSEMRLQSTQEHQGRGFCSYYSAFSHTAHFATSTQTKDDIFPNEHDL